jgi:hypothetical protein
MGPITKKIDQYLLTEGLSEETILILEKLKTEVEPIEKQMVNHAYHQGYADKEMGRRPVWNHYQSKYDCYISKMLLKNTK